MRKAPAVSVLVALVLAGHLARAQDAKPVFLDRFDFETGRLAFDKAEPDLMRAQIHGELQFRGQRQSDVPLLAPSSDPGAASLGQKKLLMQWVRFEAHFQILDKVELVGQIDVPRGFVGDTTRYVDPAAEPMAEENPVRVDARWLYADVWTPVGLFRIGQQPNHFGMGMLANDGNHPTLFGDYRRGDVSERILFATRPGGKDGKLAVFLAGDLVFRDQNATLSDGDHAFQGVLGGLYGSEHNQLGAFGLVRHQTRGRDSTGSLTPFTEALDVRAIDVNGRFNARTPGANAWFFGEAEAAGLWGTTDIVRTVEETREGNKEKIRSFGAAMRLGVAHEASGVKDRYADVTAALGWGYATGDANPADGTTRRFTMNPSFRVGLVLFDHVLAWKTARAAALAQDPNLVNRPAPGSQLLPTNGGIAGATYVNPTVVVRPMRWLDFKGGVVIASATSDVVDPFRFGANGRVQNYDGGTARRRDLGVELDGGVEARFGLEYGLTFQLGMQAGVLFPGHAFDDENGGGMPTQHVEMARAGLLF